MTSTSQEYRVFVCKICVYNCGGGVNAFLFIFTSYRLLCCTSIHRYEWKPKLTRANSLNNIQKHDPNSAKLEGLALPERLLLIITGVHNLRCTLSATSIDISHINYHRHDKMANVDGERNSADVYEHAEFEGAQVSRSARENTVGVMVHRARARARLWERN